MTEIQYTALASARPIRVCFLVDAGAFPDSNRLNALLDGIVDWNHTHWGGRGNHICLLTGDSLSDDEWRQLELADPDCILAFSPISDALVRELDGRLSPWGIEIDDQTKEDVNRLGPGDRTEGIAMPPTPENLRRVRGRSWHIGSQEQKLLMFQFADGCASEVRRFFHRNFGTFYQWTEPKTGRIRRIGWLEDLLQDIPAQSFSISDAKSAADVISALAGRLRAKEQKPGLAFIAPGELSSLFLSGPTTSELHQTYQIIVGDGTSEFSEYWNGARWKGIWNAPLRHQLWIPTNLAKSPDFREALHDWLCRYTNYGGGGYRIESISGDSEEAVGEIREHFQRTQPALHVAQVSLTESAARRQKVTERFSGRGASFSMSSDADAVRMSGLAPDGDFSLEKPPPLHSQNVDGCWTVDVQIEHLSTLENRTREQSWWHLPRRNGAGLAGAIFKAPSRVNSSGRFSVRVECREPHLSERITPRLKFHLPSDSEVIRWLLMRSDRRGYWTADARSKLAIAEGPIRDCRVSTKGAYLNKLLELFGDFWTARSYCERRLWRELFRQLSGNDPGSEEGLQRKLVEILKTEIVGSPDEKLPRAKSVAERVLHQVRGRLQGAQITFIDCLKERSKIEKSKPEEPLVYVQKATTVQHSGLAPISKDEMEEGLSSLLATGVLRLGVETRCPHCLLFTWNHVDALRQEVTCPGCGGAYPLGVREHWSYQLNSLVQMSVSQGVLGVVHALSSIASDARTFFAFSPSLDVYREGIKDVWHEVDVLCVVDGEFVIGEVKEGFVQKKDFDDLVDTARVLKPQRAVIFLPNENAKKQWDELVAWSNEMRTLLAPQRTNFEIFTLPEF